jgi:hypothetical protein
MYTESLVVGITAALASGLAFAGLQILFKREQARRLTSPHPLVLPSWLGFLCPIWLAIMLANHQTHNLTLNLAPQALVFPALWAICTVTTTTGLVWLLRHFSLSEVAGYKKALITLGALVADVSLFHTHFPLTTLAAIGLLLGGAVGLGNQRKRLPTKREWAIIVVWCSILTVQISLYKQGQNLQPSIMAHTVLAQTMATFGYALLWALPAVRQQTWPKLTTIIPLWGCALAGNILEGFAYAGLPLALVLVVTMLPAACMATYDLYRGDLPKQKGTWAALSALVAGFVLLFWAW